jgi:hypothetical protein
MNGNKPEWATVREFETRDGSIKVIVRKLGLYPRPKFSLQVASTYVMPQTQETRVSPYIQVPLLRADTWGLGRAAVDLDALNEITALLNEAARYVDTLVREAEDAYMQTRIDREAREIDRGKPVMKPGLKKLGKMHRRHAP